MGLRAADLSDFSPRPRLPYRPHPQEKTCPVETHTSECSAPHAMLVTT